MTINVKNRSELTLHRDIGVVVWTIKKCMHFPLQSVSIIDERNHDPKHIHVPQTRTHYQSIQNRITIQNMVNKNELCLLLKSRWLWQRRNGSEGNNMARMRMNHDKQIYNSVVVIYMNFDRISMKSSYKWNCKKTHYYLNTEDLYSTDI